MEEESTWALVPLLLHGAVSRQEESPALLQAESSLVPALFLLCQYCHSSVFLSTEGKGCAPLHLSHQLIWGRWMGKPSDEAGEVKFHDSVIVTEMQHSFS